MILTNGWHACWAYYNEASNILKKGQPMLYTIVVILLALWLIGLLVHIGGGLIHLLLVIALIVFIYNMITGRKKV